VGGWVKLTQSKGENERARGSWREQEGESGRTRERESK